MDNTVYIALSRQLALFRDMSTIANNVANQNTAGYKSSHLLFTDYMVDDGKGKPMAFANDVSTFDNHMKGTVQTTGNPLDVMINGHGYFMVQTPLGVRYTRAGNFQINAEGQLITATGYAVLDDNGQPIEFTDQDQQIIIGGAGNITVDGEERGILGVVEFENEYMLTRGENQLFNSEESPVQSQNPQVAQGALEGSNVQGVLEMTRMIEVSRAVGSTAKMIESMYELHRRTNQIYTQQT